MTPYIDTLPIKTTNDTLNDTQDIEIDKEIDISYNISSSSGTQNKKETNTNSIDNFSFDEVETISEVQEVENDQNIRTITDEDMNYSDEELQAVNAQAINEFQMMEETRQSQTGEVSDWFGKKIHRGYDLLTTFRGTKDRNAAITYIQHIDNEVIVQFQKFIDAGQATNKQLNAIKHFNEKYDKAIEIKNKYLSGEYKKNKAHQTQEETQDEQLFISEEKTPSEPREQANNEYLSMEELMGKNINNEKHVKKAAPATSNNDWNSFLKEMGL